MRLRPRRRPAPSIPMVSMADIAFLLIIFFMVSTTFVKESGLELTLPGAESADELEKPEEILVSVGRDRTIRVNAEPATLENLPRVLGQKLAQRRNKVVTVRADEGIEYGFVVSVMDVPKSLGAQLNLAVEKLEPGPGESIRERSQETWGPGNPGLEGGQGSGVGGIEGARGSGAGGKPWGSGVWGQ